MGYQLLVVFVEGEDDERFFASILKTSFENDFQSVIIQQYVQKERKDINNYLRSIDLRNDIDYIFFADKNDSPCVTHRKEKAQIIYSNLALEKIMIVIKEIESWYLAGLNNEALKELSIEFKRKSTEKVNKEYFESLKSKHFKSLKDFKIEILNHFSLETALQKNKSFNYTYNRLIHSLDL